MLADGTLNNNEMDDECDHLIGYSFNQDKTVNLHRRSDLTQNEALINDLEVFYYCPLCGQQLVYSL
jgi:hypothetical protein